MKQSLAVLIQHNLARFVTIVEHDRERTFYEGDWREILHLQNFGRELACVSKLVSAEGAAVLKYVMLYGKVKASDIVSAFSQPGKGASERARTFEKLLVQLISRRFLKAVQPHATRPLEDFKQMIRAEEMARGQAMTDAKKVKEVEKLIEDRLRYMSEDEHRPGFGLKRKADVDHDRPSKRHKSDGDEFALDPNTVLRVNHDKFLVHQRNEDLIALCQRRLGPVPAAVYRSILNSIEPLVYTCQQDTSNMVLSTLKICHELPKDLDLSSIWAKSVTGANNVKATKVRAKQKLSRVHAGSSDDDMGMNTEDEQFIDNDDDDLMSDDDYDPSRTGDHDHGRVNMLIRFLELFAADSCHLIRKIGSRSMGEWQIDYPHLTNTLRTTEIETIVFQKYGHLAPRLLRIIKEKRKIDEKGLSSIALLRQKDIRHILTALHESDILELQEVPKRLDRQPSMTYFLWHHNEHRARISIARTLIKSMCRVQQRLQHELQLNVRLLDKAARTDVKNKEAEYLSKDELLSLRRIRGIEETLLSVASRLQNSYAILMEY